MRRSYVSSGLISFTIGTIILALVVFGVLQALKMPAGNFLDWLIGIGAFAWLMTVVVVPWDIHFEASEVLNEAETSEKHAINFDQSQIPYVKRLKRTSLFIAIILHITSAGGLYWVAASGISVVGYFGAGAALLLTMLRPAIRAYEYISTRLANIRQQIKYPREDVLKLQADLEEVLSNLKTINFTLDEDKPESWRRQQETNLRQQRQWLETLSADLKGFKQQHLEQWEKISREMRQQFEKIREDNQHQYERISDEHKQNLAKLSRDGKFVDNFVENLAEIVRFIKRA
jgi:hypothetical protein